MKNTIEVPKDIMIGLYLIMANISSTFSNYEVYDEAKSNMSEAYDFIIKYGHENNIEIHGENFKKFE
jgi:hypothetical protein